MELTIGSLQLTRTNPAHLGTQPLVDLTKKQYLDSFGTLSNSLPEEPKERDSFESYLLQAVETMNGQQIEVSNLTERAITDPDSVDIHDVTIAMAKAQMSLNLAQTVIDRVITGWNELSQTR